MNLGLYRREHLHSGNAELLGSATVEQFQRTHGAITAWQEVEHTAEGSHTDIHCESIDVAGDALIHGDLAVDGDANVSGDLDVAGSTHLVDALIDTLQVTDDLVVGDDLTVGDDVFIGGDTQMDGTLSVEGKTLFHGDLRIEKSVPVLTFCDTSQPANQRVFHVYGGSQRMAFNCTNDDNTNSKEVFNFTRTGDLNVNRDIYEKQRSVPMGHWVAEPYNAAHYSAAAPLTFAPTAGQVTYNRYAVVGKTLHWKLSLNAAVIGGSGSGNLFIQLPGGYVAAQTANNMGTVCATPSWGTPVYAASSQGGPNMTLFPVPAFSFAPGTLYLDLDIRVEIQ